MKFLANFQVANFQLHLLDNSILHVNVSQEWLIIVDNLCSFDKETIALKGGCNITQLRMQELNKDMVLSFFKQPWANFIKIFGSLVLKGF